MASQLELFLPANSYTTHLLSSIRATNEGIAVLEVWSIFPFAIKRILGIKRIFPCSFANKRMRLLTRVYGTTKLIAYFHQLNVKSKSILNSTTLVKLRPTDPLQNNWYIILVLRAWSPGKNTIAVLDSVVF